MDDLPNRWKWEKLGDACEINPSKREIVDLSDKQEVSFVPMASVSEEGKIVAEETRLLKDVIAGFTYFVKGDVLVAKITPCFENGKRALVNGIQHKIGFGTTEFHVLRPKKEVISEWIYYIISSQKFRNFGKRNMTGTAGQKRIPKKFIENYEIPVPPLPVQKRIVAILERAEKLKERRQQANDETNTIIQSLFYEMFGENKYPSEEILTRIEEVASRDPTKRPDDLFKYVDIAGIDNQTGRIKEFKEILGKDAPSRARREIRENDIIVSTVRPNLNATALIPKELDNQICSTGFCILRCKKTLNPGYLFTITRQKKFVDELVSKMKGASYPAVTNTDVLKVKIPIPPISLQNQFASLVEKIESLKQKQSDSTSEIGILFDALMQKAFNGELVK